MNKIELLAPTTREKVEKMVHFLDSEKIPYRIIETLRTAATQTAYYAQGREPLESVNAKRKAAGLQPLIESDNKYKITWTLKSNHLSGHAIDIVPMVDGKVPWNINTDKIASAYKRLGEIGESVGLSWGGRWKPLDKFGIGKDAPHFEEVL
jgi:peptidoglycan L-alanyl-D-glutamate endopeptidase CwlK